MFIDYLTLLLVNMTAGFVLLGWYVAVGLDDTDQRRWVPGFGIVGVIALVFGAHITLTWLLPGPFNMAFDELSVLFGVLLLAAAVAMAAGWSLFTVALYAFFAGLAAMVVGARIINLELTQQPLLAGVGFILSGIAGVLAAPTLVVLRANKPFRYAAAAVLLITAVIWGLTGYGAYWMHFDSMRGWVPLVLRGGG